MLNPEPDTEALAVRIRAQHPLSPSAPGLARLDTPVEFLENLFTGRTAEYQALIERYGHAATKAAAGRDTARRSGIGKTRLAKEFLTWAVDQEPRRCTETLLRAAVVCRISR